MLVIATTQHHALRKNLPVAVAASFESTITNIGWIVQETIHAN
ncbi:MAG: hypothetical protein NWQ13_01710 [Glaciimonas sp.]|nr:hypothetical protein [Glaciimonas sp.]